MVLGAILCAVIGATTAFVEKLVPSVLSVRADARQANRVIRNQINRARNY